MAKFIAALIATLTLFGAPAAYASQAAHPTHPTHPSKHQGDHEHSMTTYTLRGTVVSYGSASGSTEDSISITLTSSHVEGTSSTGTSLTDTSLAFLVTPSTRIVLHKASSLAPGDPVLVKVRATKGLPIATLGDGFYPAQAVIDQGKRGADLGDHRGKNHEHSMATYVFRGALSNYFPASASGSGTITVTLLPRRLWDMNLTGTAVTGTTLMFHVAPTTHIVLHKGSTITNGDLGVVLVRAPKGSDTNALGGRTAQAVIDQARSGASHGDHGKDQEHSNVTYTVQGTVSGFKAGSSITVTLPPPRFWGTPLTGTAVTATTLTFTIDASTRIVSRNGSGISTGDQVLVKVRAPKGSSLATIESIPATAIIDQAGRH
jgi:hypothetical protein